MNPLDPSILYLTSTGRLARRLRHIHRMSNLSTGRTGWESLRSVSLNDWLRARWLDVWSENSPAHLLKRLRLWLELAGDEPPPGALPVDLSLCRALDDAYETLVRHGLDPSTGFSSSPLVEWRRRLSLLFNDHLRSSGSFHPSELPLLVSRHIQAGVISCPDTIALIGFDSPAPVEADLFRALQKKSRLFDGDEPYKKPDRLEAIALPSREQEVYYLIQCLIEDAQFIPLHRIGVVIPEFDVYAGMLESCLTSVAGPRPEKDSTRFNLSLGKRLNTFSLIRASMLPLRILLNGEDRESLLSFFLSPYFRWGDPHRIARADLVWRDVQIESGIIPLINLLKKKSPHILDEIAPQKLNGLLDFCRVDIHAKKPFVSWLRSLDDLWSILEFPVISDETDAIAHGHLRGILDGMMNHLSDLFLTGRDFLSWFDHTTAGEISQPAAPEEAGIQILGLIESRGHDFDKLYLLGLVDGSLPRPVRPLPLLDTWERKQVQGGTAESQYDFSDRAFRRLLSSASNITLLRPQQSGPEPFLPSPFWPANEREVQINIWTNPGRSLLRAQWLKEACDGLPLYSRFKGDPMKTIRALGKASVENHRPTAVSVPDVLSVSEMEKAIFCPHRFFFDVVLNLKPLRDTERTLFPVERGKRLHRVFSLFTREIRKRGLSPDGDPNTLKVVLAQCADQALEDMSHHFRWMVERRFWLDEGGLLQKWLSMESEHARVGWKVMAEEMSFDSLNLRGWHGRIKGRIDRIDVHPVLGILCLDYKTGNHPDKRDIFARLTAPQLPLYLMALKQGTVIGLQLPEEDSSLSAGYVRIKSPTDSGMLLMDGSDSPWTDHLERWQEVFANTGKLLHEAGFPPRPFPFSRVDNRDSFCALCPCLTLCERGLIPDVLQQAEAEDDEVET